MMLVKETAVGKTGTALQVGEGIASGEEPQEVRDRRFYSVVKRTADFVLSLAASLLLLLPMAFLALLIVAKDPGNPFYFHTRVGQGRRPIRVLKLRTMRRGADRLEEMLTPEQLAEYQREYKVSDDPRLLGWQRPGDGARCFGARLRQLSLDELPQIPYNVLWKGDMAIVGPRPILEGELAEHYTAAEQELLLSVKPGLTGYWQAYARNEARYKDGRRQQMELWYVRNRSLGLDVKIIFATVSAVLGRRGAK